MGKKATSIRIEESLAVEGQRVARERGIPFGTLLEDALRVALGRGEAEPKGKPGSGESPWEQLGVRAAVIEDIVEDHEKRLARIEELAERSG